MTVTIDLPPEQERELQRRAAARGLEAAEYLRQLAIENLAGAGDADNPNQLPYGEWRKRFDALIDFSREATRHLPPGHVVDDSRETLYAGRDE